jgi:hypothetical protein
VNSNFVFFDRDFATTDAGPVEPKRSFVQVPFHEPARVFGLNAVWAAPALAPMAPAATSARIPVRNLTRPSLRAFGESSSP